MIKLEVKKENQWYELDTNDIPISLNYRQDDIKDVGKKKNSFSKTINLPGTERNLEFFQWATEVNIDLTNFDVKQGFKAKLYTEDQLVFEGDLILIKVVKTGEYKNTIEVNITTPLKSIDDLLNDIFLSDLKSLSRFCHQRTQQTQVDSWTNKIFIEDELVQSQLGVGYVYPYIIRGSNDEWENFSYYYDLQPAIYTKTIIDAIFDELDITVKSNFFDSEYFRRLIIPFTSGDIQQSEEEVLNKSTVVGLTDNFALMQSFTMAPTYTQITSWHYTDSYFLSPYQLPLNRTTGTVTENGEDVNFLDPGGQWNNATNIMTINESGYYDIDLTLNFFLEYLPQRDDQPFKYNNNGGVEWRWQLQRYNGSTWTNIATSNDYGGQGIYGVLFVQPSTDVEQPAGPWLDIDSPLLVPVVLNEYWLNEGDQLRFRFGFKPLFFNNSWRVGGLFTNNRVGTRVVLATDNDGIASKFSVTPSSDTGYGNEQICLNNIAPKVKSFDFLLDIIKMFNLIVYEEDDILIIEPADNFYDSKPNIKDWNDKIDMELYEIQPMSEVNFNEWSFTYREDSDWLNKIYNEEFNEVFGKKVIRLDNIFSNQKGELSINFSPTPTYEVAGKIAPILLTEELTPHNSNIRMLFYGGLKPGVLKIRDKIENFIETTYNNYPYCGMWDDPYNPQWDLAFGVPSRLYYDTDITPLNNLFNTFHKRTFLSIIDRNAKLLTGYFDLDAYDIKDFDFRDIIFLFGQYWRVNIIEDYNPVNPDLTKVELYKIIEPKIYIPTVVESGTQNACPLDVVRKGFTYISLSGAPLGEECCKSVGGHWNGKVCSIFTVVGPILDPVVPNVPVTPVLDRPITIDWRFTRPTVNVWRAPEVISAISVGRNNVVTKPNTILIGNNLKTNEVGTININGTIISESGIDKRYKIINPGRDVVRPIFSLNPEIIRIYSGKDEVRQICYNHPYEIINPNLDDAIYSSNNWILSTGFWNDNGEWVDTSSWND